MGINVAQIVRHQATVDPERGALTLDHERGPQTVSYRELDGYARRAAGALAAQGVEPGARIALCVENGLGFLAAFFGALYQGVTVLPIPPMSAPPELSFRLRHARCTLLIGDASTEALGRAALADVEGVPSLAVDTLLASTFDHEGPRDLPEGSVAMVLYTSGTTGQAKGAMITHASLLTHTAALVHHVLRLTPQDVVLACLPLTHSYGIRMTLLAPFYAGAHVVLHKRFAAARVLATLDDARISWFPGVPTMFHALAQEPTRSHAHSSLRWCLSAGAPLPNEIRARAEQALGTQVRQGFGLTEATFSTVARPDDEADADTVGRPVFGVEVRVIDEAGAPLPAGQAGEVVVRGQNVMAGYLDDPAATSAALRGGWLHSGDVGVLDEQGRLRIVDRIKDMILRGGFNVYPAEVEAVLVTHPAIYDAVVVGTPDERYGEEVVAVIVQRMGSELDLRELDSFCRARLSRTKLPRLLGRVQAMPVGASGKVQRRVIRSEVQQGKIQLVALPRSEQGA